MSAGRHHAASAVIRRPAGAVFDFLADGRNLGRWALGMSGATVTDDGLVTGKSLFDGATGLARIDADRGRMAIDFHLGAAPDDLMPRIAAKVVPGTHLGIGDGRSVFTLLAWRTADMDDDRWRRLAATHELEVTLVKALLEQEDAQ